MTNDFEISKGSLGAKYVKVLLSPEQALFYKKKKGVTNLLTIIRTACD